MKQRPILFSTQMVRAILAGKKTQTRRVIKLTDFGQSDTRGYDWHYRDKCGVWNDLRHTQMLGKCPYGVVGDQLWVRETTIIAEEHGYQEPIYVASELGACVLDSGLRPAPDDMCDVEPHDIKLRPSIFMPRKFCRIILEITDVRIERVQDISDQDAIAEGIEFSGIIGGMNAHQNYCSLWSRINGNQSWIENPWVWVVEFRVMEGSSYAN